jgi:hypothetical protein
MKILVDDEYTDRARALLKARFHMRGLCRDNPVTGMTFAHRLDPIVWQIRSPSGDASIASSSISTRWFARADRISALPTMPYLRRPELRERVEVCIVCAKRG